MKKYISIYLLLVLAIILGMLLYNGFGNQPLAPEVDIQEVNNIVKEAQNNWSQPQNLGSQSFAYAYCVVDLNDQIIHAANRNIASTLEGAIKDRLTILDITQEGTVVGRVFIQTYTDEPIQILKAQTAQYTFLMLILLCTVSLIFLLFINRKFNKHFDKK